MNAKTTAKTTVNAKTTTKAIVAAALAAALVAGVGAAPALADECGTWDYVPVESSTTALITYHHALDIAVAALPISGWDEVASLDWHFYSNGTYDVEIHATSGRWWIVWVDGWTGEIEAIL